MILIPGRLVTFKTQLQDSGGGVCAKPFLTCHYRLLIPSRVTTHIMGYVKSEYEYHTKPTLLETSTL